MANYVPGDGWVPYEEWARRKSIGQQAGRRNPDHARRVLAGQRRALSVRRPWANLIIDGIKTVENRTWPTDYRADLVVHAGQAWDSVGAAAAAELGFAGISQLSPSGYLGIVRLVDVHPAGDCCAPWGEQGSGVFHWVLANPRAFREPIAGAGKPGLYWVGPELLAGLDQ